jgi:NTP pyrophosphatase (non-canonical NTP hydrolase)
MITQEDIDAFAAMTDVNTQEYSYWVEGMIVTEGETRLIENVLGLVGEAGEVAEKIKKMLRDSNKVSPEEIVLELGDVTFYVTSIANYFHSDLTEVLQANMDKLNSRARRGVIKGSGDNR